MGKFVIERDEEFPDKYVICYIDHAGFWFTDHYIAKQIDLPLEVYDAMLKAYGAIVMRNDLSKRFEDARYLFNTELQAQEVIPELVKIEELSHGY